MDIQEYKNMVDELKENFSETIPEEEKKLCEEYEKFLYQLIEILTPNSKSQSDVIKKIKSYDRYIKTLSIQNKKKEIVFDKSLEEIRQESLHIYGIAQKMLYGEEVNVDIDPKQEKEKLKKLLKTVESFNINEAKNLVSEAIIDLGYIFKTSPYMSLRLAHDFKQKKTQEKISDEER